MERIFQSPSFTEWGQSGGNGSMQTSGMKKAKCILAILLAGVVLLAGSAGARAQDGDPNEINGEVPSAPTEHLVKEDAGKMSFVSNSGNFIQIEPGHRTAGTRSPVHTHPNSGVTCVLQGEMTLILEGVSDETFYGDISQGEVNCYKMPAPDGDHVNKMSAENTGTIPALIIDIFPVPAGQDWEVFQPLCVIQTVDTDGYTTGAGCD